MRRKAHPKSTPGPEPRSQMSWSRVLPSVHTHPPYLIGQPLSEGPRGPGCGSLRGVVPWAGLVDRRRPRSTFPRSPIRGRECRSWRCQGEGCEVARTQFGSSQVAEEASARAGAGAETRACHHDLLAAGGEPPTLQGGQPRGVLTLRTLPARSMPPPSQEAGPASPSTPQLSKCRPATGSSHPPTRPQKELSGTQSPRPAKAPHHRPSAQGSGHTKLLRVPE